MLLYSYSIINLNLYKLYMFTGEKVIFRMFNPFLRRIVHSMSINVNTLLNGVMRI